MLSSVLLLVARLSTALAMVALIGQAFPAAQHLWGYATGGCTLADADSPPDLANTLTRLRSVLPAVPHEQRLDDPSESYGCTATHS